jgi:branched-chain amino acid transport system ATP-binding protein
MEAVFAVCDRVVVLDYGKKIAEGEPKRIATDKKVVEAYLGEPLA